MTTEPSTDGLTFTRDCYGTPIRIYMFEGCPWFEASAICAAMRIDPSAIESFNRKALDTDIAQYSFDDEPVPVLSPIGVWKFAEANDGYRLAKFAAWSKREADKLVPTPATDDPRLWVTLTPDGKLPAIPNKYSGRRAQWEDLKYSDAGLAAYFGRPTVVQELQRKPFVVPPRKAPTSVLSPIL